MAGKVRQKKLPKVFDQLFDALGNKRQFLARMAFASMSEKQKELAERVLPFKKAMFERAVELGPRVWTNWDFVKDNFKYSFEEPTNVYASIWADGKQYAIRRKVIQKSKTPYVLNIHHSMLELTPEQQDKVLLHELVHMGYSGHSRDFITVCREVGGAVSGSGVTEPGVHLEQKQGSRYKRIRTFDTEQKARDWYRLWLLELEMQAREKGVSDADWRAQRTQVIGKWRVIIGT
jgi:hypothetical protein